MASLAEGKPGSVVDHHSGKLPERRVRIEPPRVSALLGSARSPRFHEAEPGTWVSVARRLRVRGSGAVVQGDVSRKST
jgi:hypothetical protein